MAGLVSSELGEDFADRAYCGGTLIEKRVVATAAHCVDILKKQLHVVLGSNNARGPSERLIKVTSIAVHPDWEGTSSSSMDNDIALLFLEDYDAQGFDQTVHPISIDRTYLSLTTDQKAKVIGWGNSSSFGTIFRDELREVEVPLVDTNICKSAYRDLLASQICAGDMDHGGADSCQGDSGGPLVSTADDNTTLIGIVSYGSDCAQKGKPGVYTRVSSYITWIDETIATHTDLKSAPSAKALTTLVKSHCFATSEVSTFKSEGLVNLTSKSTLKIGQLFIPEIAAGPVPAGSLINTCEFSIDVNEVPNAVKVELIGNESAARYIAEINGKKYHAPAVNKSEFSINCTVENESTYLSANFNPESSWNMIHTDTGSFYLSSKSNKNLEEFETQIACELGTTAVRVLKKVSDFAVVVNSPTLPGGFAVYDAHAAITLETEDTLLLAALKATGEKKGTLTLQNKSDADIFSWQLSCNKEMTLTDKFGATHLAKNSNGSFVHDFIYPAHLIAGWKNETEVEFTYNATNELDTSLSCSVNQMKMNIVFDGNIPQPASPDLLSPADSQ